MPHNDPDTSPDSGANEGQTPQQPQAPPFDPSADHQLRPKLRPTRGMMAKRDEQLLLGIVDAQQLSQKMVFTVPAAQVVLPLMNGENDLDTIIEQVGRGLTRQMLEQLIAQLDDAALIEGPNFETLRQKLREEYDATENLPPASTAAFGDMMVIQKIGEDATDEQKLDMAPDLIRKQFDAWMNESLKEADDPSFDELPKAIIAPHLDYPRGWQNYAHAYGRMRVVDKPDRVVVLGTNHFGASTGVCGCDKGFETPLGLSPLDEAFKQALDEALPDDAARTMLYADRFDHEREHSIELQVMWLQHVFGASDDGRCTPIYAALIHDPAQNGGESYDGAGLGLMPFIDAVKSAIEASPGRTLVVSSADLSHVGPQFGDPTTVAGDEEKTVQFRNHVLKHDQEMLQIFATGKPEELVSSMAWQQNPTRWCSVGNMVAAARITEPETVRILQYTATMDQQGTALITSCAAVMQ